MCEGNSDMLDNIQKIKLKIMQMGVTATNIQCMGSASAHLADGVHYFQHIIIEICLYVFVTVLGISN